MLAIFLTTLPIYLMIVIGFVAVRSGYFDSAHIGSLSLFALKVCLIALIFSSIAIPRGDAVLSLPFMAAYLGGSLVLMVLGAAASRLILRQPAPDSWVLAMGMSNSNSAYLGFPLASLFFGAEGALVFAMTMIIENTVTIPLATIAAGAAGQSGERLAVLVAKALGRVVRNPLVIAVAIALPVRLLGVPIAVPLERAVMAMAGAASPVALFVVGGTVAGMSVSGHWRRASAVTFGKLVVHPLMVGAALMLVPGVPVALIPVGILFAAVPMPTIYPILSEAFGLRAVSATSLIVSTVLSCFTVSLVLVLVTAG